MLQHITRSARRNFIALTWLLVLPVFVDQTDVMDLVSDVLVLHDDGEIASPSGSALPNQSATTGATTSSSPALKVLYDQDSPSPVPVSFVVLLGQALDAGSDQTPRFVKEPLSSSLYLLHRSFLL